MKSGIACNDNYLDKTTNICFLKDITFDTTYFGDTLEIEIYGLNVKKGKCFTYNGVPINKFGFYPNVDTIVYRSNSESKNRMPEMDFPFEKFQSIGIYPRPVQSRLFKDFVKKNKNIINPWLKKEAERRGYFD